MEGERKEGGREEGGREGGRERGREGEREGGRESKVAAYYHSSVSYPNH